MNQTQIVKTVDLYATNGAKVQLSALNLGEWHAQTATSEARGFLALALRATFFHKVFRFRILGKHALDILNQIDERAPELEPTGGAFLAFVTACVRAHRQNGIAISRA